MIRMSRPPPSESFEIFLDVIALGGQRFLCPKWRLSASYGRFRIG